ncbi:hypothetical protein ACQRD6_09420 [Prevotella sp. SGI.027]
MKKKLLIIAACALTLGVNAQTLDNGITLPSVWPPRYADPTAPKEMPVPYLKQKPEVLLINRGRQLFVDSFLISNTNLTSVYHKANYYDLNPVLKVDRKWELTPEGYEYAAPFSDGIWYDDKDGKFKMWYLAGAGYVDTLKHSLYTCYAESLDGKTWTKPSLDIVPGTNVVDTMNRDASTVWLDRNEKDPSKRWKFFNVEYKPDYIQWQYVLKYSADGIHWSKPVAQSGAVSDRCTAFYNPFTNKWVMSMRHHCNVSWRSRAYLEHADPEEAVSLAHRLREGVPDKHIVFWFTPDDKEKRHERYPDVDPGIYNFDAIAYESIMLGFYSQWQGPENHIARGLMIPKRNEIMLGYSRDGFHFSRPSHSPFMPVNETDGAWNYGNMQSVNGVPLIVGDSLYIYSSGRSKNGVWWDAGVSTGLATLRRDGFVSMRASIKEGFLTTEKLSFDGSYFFVNANVKAKGAQLKVELLDADGNPIPGFTKRDCIVMRGADNTKQLITWKGKQNLTELQGRTIRAKFYLTHGDLYAFWVSPWASGESRGYTAGGGPGLNASGVDTK